MSNSPLVTYTNLTKNHSGKRTHAIDTITIHCIVGQWTAKQGCDYFATTDRECSANYVVGKDGSIGLSVEEKNRSWCSSSRVNDQRAITIEVASDTKHPYAVTDAAYEALIKLCADICKRNGIKQLVWSTNKNDRVNHLHGCNMTVHRDFANKACPGQYLYDRHGDIAERVNKILGVTEEVKPAPAKPATKLTVDGLWGKATTTRLQQIFGTPVDGVVSNQWATFKAANPGLCAGFEWEAKPNGRGSALIRAMQKWAGMPVNEQDGEIGPKTIRAIQKKLGTPVDGCVSRPSAMVKALQKWANAQ